MSIHVLTQRWTLIAFTAIGLLLTFAIVKLQPAMTHDTEVQKLVPVSVITAQPHIGKPSIVGYGTVKPDLNLKAQAEVAGRVTFVHPDLDKGAFLAEGTLVVTIDDKDYTLSLKQAEADLLATRANVQEMDMTIQNNILELKLANEKLKVRRAELARLEQLRSSGTISQSQLDQERQAMLVQQQEVQQLENKRTTLPSEREVLVTKIDIAQAQLEQSQRNLARTQIHLPFTGRVSGVFVEKDQYVNTGTNLFDLVGMQKVTINTQFPVNQFGRFAAHLNRPNFNFNDPNQYAQLSKLVSRLGLTANVEVAGEDYKSWQATVERIIDDLDPNSGTVGVLVSVGDSYSQVEPGVRPPLLEGMYMRVTLQGPLGEFIALPRYALQGNQIFVVTSSNTLERVTLNDVYYQGELALVRTDTQQDVREGDRIIVSDLFPAVNGMAVNPVEDDTVSAQMRVWLELGQ